MTQPDMFADPPASYPVSPGFKAAGPAQDAAAAMKPKAATIREGVLACLSLGPATPEQVAARLGLDILAVRPRFSELKAMGKVEKTRERGKSRAGLTATVWRLAA